MVKISHSIVVNATQEAAFGYLTDPANTLRIWPNLIRIKEVRKLPNGGQVSAWVYRLGGVPIEGETETTELIPPQRVVFTNRDPIDREAVVTLTFEAEAEGTRVGYSIEYRLPIPFLGGALATLIQRQLDAEAEWILQNLNAAVEPPLPS